VVLPAADGTTPSVSCAQGLLRLAQLLRLLERPPKRLLLLTSGAQDPTPSAGSTLLA
jgi:hypothetical protein